MGDVGAVAPMPWDLDDKESVRAAVAGCDAVVNLVGSRIATPKWSFDRLCVSSSIQGGAVFVFYSDIPFHSQRACRPS